MAEDSLRPQPQRGRRRQKMCPRCGGGESPPSPEGRREHPVVAPLRLFGLLEQVVGQRDRRFEGKGTEVSARYLERRRRERGWNTMKDGEKK